MDYQLSNSFIVFDNESILEINGGVNVGLIAAGVIGAVVITVAIGLASAATSGASNAVIPKSAVASAYIACAAAIITGFAS